MRTFIAVLAALVVAAGLSSVATAAPQVQISKKCKPGWGIRYKGGLYGKPYCKHIVKSATTDTATFEPNGSCTVNGTAKTYKGEYSLTVTAEVRSNGKDVKFPLTTTSPRSTKKFKLYALVIPRDLHMTGPIYEARFIVEGKKTNFVTCVQPPAGL